MKYKILIGLFPILHFDTKSPLYATIKRLNHKFKQTTKVEKNYTGCCIKYWGVFITKHIQTPCTYPKQKTFDVLFLLNFLAGWWWIISCHNQSMEYDFQNCYPPTICTNLELPNCCQLYKLWISTRISPQVVDFSSKCNSQALQIPSGVSHIF